MSIRLDRELAGRGLARSRSHAQQLIGAGVVRLNGRACHKASVPVTDDDELRLIAADPYVSRAAHKLRGALDELSIPVGGRALDAGASTGGFSQVLLECGCDPVYAVDVGHDQLDSRLRDDPRLRAYESVNILDVELDLVDSRPVDLVVADLSFVSLHKVLHRLVGLLRAGGVLLVLVKPQFEVGRQRVGFDGVVGSPQLRRRAVSDVIDTAAALGWWPRGIAGSQLPGQAGNREFFVWFADSLDRDAAADPDTPDKPAGLLDALDWE